MNEKARAMPVVVVGGGMIVRIQLLPSLLHLRRLGVIGEVHVCDKRPEALHSLAEDPSFKKCFPDQSFTTHPNEDAVEKVIPEVTAAGGRGIVVVAVPDQVHYGVVMAALKLDQHVLCVKPLALEYSEAEEIAQLARDKGLVVGIEYHKRFDERSLLARRRYRKGEFGEFKMGCAHLIECWYYRHSNFQNWCISENSDMFTYIGCHYVDLVHFITGLKPTSVSVYGIEEPYPNGNMGYLWADARVKWENGAVLNVQTGLGYPDDGPGGNAQGLVMYCSGEDQGGLLVHSDQYRGIKYCFVKKGDRPGDTLYSEPSPDYFLMQERGGAGREPTGYGYRSIEYIIKAAIRAEKAAEGLDPDSALERRRETLTQLDQEAIMATPANSSYNELVVGAGRKSLFAGGREVAIDYGPPARIEFCDHGGT